MTRAFHRGWVTLVVSAATGYGVWKHIPGTNFDRIAFTTVASGFENPPLFVSGHGTYDAPWKLRSFAERNASDRKQAPVVVSLDDDPDHVFQASPPEAIDLAVILSNFHRLGAKKAAVASVMAWDKADPVALAALDKSLRNFDSLVTAAPLTRGPVAGPMPPAFRHASIPMTAVSGDVSALPLVNRVPFSPVILGEDNALAGFSVLEMEAAQTRSWPLFARWEDRVVFSFPLLVVLQRLDLKPDDVSILLGKFIKLGNDGPLLPIDRFGRFTLPPKPVAAYVEISAAELIDGHDDLFPKEAPDPVILRDDQSAAEPATQAFSKSLAPLVAAIASDTALATERPFPRLPVRWEMALLGAMALLLTAFARFGELPRSVAAIGLMGIAIAAQWMALGTASLWLPCSALAAMAFVAAVVELAIPDKADLLLEEEESEDTSEEVAPADVAPIAEESPELPKKAARKTATKTAKKTSPHKSDTPKEAPTPAPKTKAPLAKKAAAKKSAKPRSKRGPGSKN